LSGGGLKLPTDLRLRLRGDRGGGRALRAVKSGNRPRPAFSLALQMGPSDHAPSRDRAMLLFKFCAVCDAAFVPTRRDAKFCLGGCRQACYRARKGAKRRRPGGPPTSPSAMLSV
jgi:hypothetical protein